MHEHELGREVWRRPVNGWVGTFVLDDLIWTGPDDGSLPMMMLDPADGSVVREAHMPMGVIIGVSEDALLLLDVSSNTELRLAAVGRRSLKPLWSREGGCSDCANAGSRFLIQHDMRAVVTCLDVATGKVEWTHDFEADWPATSGRGAGRRIGIATGFPSLVPVGDRVIVVLQDRTVCVLDLASGRLLEAKRTSYAEPHVVTGTSIFFLDPYSLSEFDHSSMKEVSRIGFRREVLPLYGRHTPSVCGFWLSNESVIWTTRHGSVMGVSRGANEDGRRVAWVDDLGAVLPYGEFPLAHGDYLYVRDSGGKDWKHFGLYSFGSWKAGNGNLTGGGKALAG
jgi:hypothetical protein